MIDKWLYLNEDLTRSGVKGLDVRFPIPNDRACHKTLDLRNPNDQSSAADRTMERCHRHRHKFCLGQYQQQQLKEACEWIDFFEITMESVIFK